MEPLGFDEVAGFESSRWVKVKPLGFSEAAGFWLRGLYSTRLGNHSQMFRLEWKSCRIIMLITRFLPLTITDDVEQLRGDY
jgi:hypothetical protein